MKRPTMLRVPAWLMGPLILFSIFCMSASAQSVSIEHRTVVLSGLCGDGATPGLVLTRLVTHALSNNEKEQVWVRRIITALKEGQLICNDSDQALINDGRSQLNAITLEAVLQKSSNPPYVPSMVIMRKVAITSAEVNLFSSDQSVRREAAGQIDKFYSLLDASVITQILKNETDSEVRSMLTLAFAKRGLKSSDKKDQLAAILAVSQSPSQASRTLLSNLLGDKNFTDPELKLASQTAIRHIDQWLLFANICSILFSGLSYASILLLTALGLSVIFGLMGVINLAHGEFITIGAYSTFIVEQLMKSYAPAYFDAYIFVAIPIAFCVCAIFGMVLEYCVIRFLYRRPLETLLATWAVSLAMIKSIQLLFGSQNVEFINPAFLNGGVQVFAGFVVTYNRVFAIILALLIFTATLLIIRYTRFGLLIRATTQLRDTARSLGVPAERIDRISFGLGAGLAGLAGVVLTQIASVNPSMGTSFVIDAFMVVVLGGAGSLIGTAVSSLALGEINQWIEPLYGSVTAKVAVLIIIVLIIQRRPQGLFTSKTRT